MDRTTDSSGTNELAAADLGEPICIDAREASGAKDDRAGIALAAAAYGIWGIVPIYWRMLSAVPPFQLTVHRVFWCALFLTGLMFVRRRSTRLISLFRDRRLIGTLALTSVLISINWTIYIYCVATDQLVEASLGYYINPLISIALGVIFFRERMSRLRLVAVLVAAAAVAVQAVKLGHVPWIAPALALSFGFYGYFRKRTDVDSLDGLTIETWILFPLTFGLVLFWGATGTGAFAGGTVLRGTLLVLGGPLTAVPLAMFAAGARRIRLSTLGFLQYFSPSITLLIAVLAFGEPFTRTDAITFGFVWAALLLVAMEGRLARARIPRRQEPAR